jgi:macrocin-O-methyltransferase TylF-like protien
VRPVPIRIQVKRFLVFVGSHLPERSLRAVNATANYLALGGWLRRRNLRPLRVVDGRDGIADAVADLRQGRTALFLEFGVAEGASIRRWSARLTNPRDRFIGFDSFEGLPARWLDNRQKGHFSTGGRLPETEDPRISFVKGWFHESLPNYQMPEHEWLIVHFDADLYSSTVCALDWLREYVKPGTVLCFDEFNHQADELRAFDEFIDSAALSFALVAASQDSAHVAFRCLG